MAYFDTTTGTGLCGGGVPLWGVFGEGLGQDPPYGEDDEPLGPEDALVFFNTDHYHRGRGGRRGDRQRALARKRAERRARRTEARPHLDGLPIREALRRVGRGDLFGGGRLWTIFLSDDGGSPPETPRWREQTSCLAILFGDPDGGGPPTGESDLFDGGRPARVQRPADGELIARARARRTRMLALNAKRRRAAMWRRKKAHDQKYGSGARLRAKRAKLVGLVRAQLLGVAKTDAAKLMAKRHAELLYKKMELTEWEQEQYPLEECFLEVMKDCMVPSAQEMSLVAPVTPGEYYNIQMHYAVVRKDCRFVWEPATKEVREESMPSDKLHPIRAEARRRSEEEYGKAVERRPLARFLHRVSRPLGRALYHSLRQSLKQAPVRKQLLLD